MSEGQQTNFDPGEIAEDLQGLKNRFDEFRGRL